MFPKAEAQTFGRALRPLPDSRQCVTAAWVAGRERGALPPTTQPYWCCRSPARQNPATLQVFDPPHRIPAVRPDRIIMPSREACQHGEFYCMPDFDDSSLSSLSLDTSVMTQMLACCNLRAYSSSWEAPKPDLFRKAWARFDVSLPPPTSIRNCCRPVVQGNLNRPVEDRQFNQASE